MQNDLTDGSYFTKIFSSVLILVSIIISLSFSSSFTRKEEGRSEDGKWDSVVIMDWEMFHIYIHELLIMIFLLHSWIVMLVCFQLLSSFRSSRPWERPPSAPKQYMKPLPSSPLELEREIFSAFLANRFHPRYVRLKFWSWKVMHIGWELENICKE